MESLLIRIIFFIRLKLKLVAIQPAITMVSKSDEFDTIELSNIISSL